MEVITRAHLHNQMCNAWCVNQRWHQPMITKDDIISCLDNILSPVLTWFCRAWLDTSPHFPCRIERGVPVASLAWPRKAWKVQLHWMVSESRSSQGWFLLSRRILRVKIFIITITNELNKILTHCILLGLCGFFGRLYKEILHQLFLFLRLKMNQIIMSFQL